MRLPEPMPGRVDDPGLEPLRSTHVGGLRFLLHSRFTGQGLAEHLAANPGLSWRDASTGQYIVGGFWRRRPDIAVVLELSPGQHRLRLLRRLVEAAGEIGCQLAIAELTFSDREVARWREAGFVAVDAIVEYERIGPPPALAAATGDPRAYDPADLAELIELDHRSFPWLWHTSTSELARYTEAAESEIFVTEDPIGQLTGYVGLTVRGGHGHLDRLAVAPEHRRRGLGTQLLAYALDRLRQRGARRVTLTTQVDNERAQPLYARMGFKRTRQMLTMYGCWIGTPRDRTP